MIAQSLRISDELFLIALNDSTGEHRVAGPVLRAGLAAGLIGELLIGGCAELSALDVLTATDRPAADPQGHHVLEHLRVERHPLSTWLEFLAINAIERIARRLVQAQIIVRLERGLLRRKVLYLPVQATDVAYRPVRISRALGQHGSYEVVTAADEALVLICHAIGLTGYLLRDVDDPTHCHKYLDYLHHKVQASRPDVHRLVTVLGEHIGVKALTGR